MLLRDLTVSYVKFQELKAPIGASLKEKINRCVKVFGHLNAETSGTLYAEVAKKEWEDASPSTVSRYLRQTRAILSWGQREGLISHTPNIPLPYVNDVRFVDVSPTDLEMILATAKAKYAWAYPTLLLLSHTGARLSEAMGIKPEDVRQSGNSVVIHKPVGRKSKTISRVVPLTKELRREIDRGWNFFLSEKGNRISNPQCASRVFGNVLHSICKECGIVELHLHDLRHAFAALLASRGADLGDIASLLGHSSLQMTMRYRGLVTGRAEEVISRI